MSRSIYCFDGELFFESVSSASLPLKFVVLLDRFLGVQNTMTPRTAHNFIPFVISPPPFISYVFFFTIFTRKRNDFKQEDAITLE
ncbi:hypothetical protein CEXT_108401 [Caerostris extrusa]|uniref:Uncharacterized protein n=1 Tax=Caerostris extrusa TaxID=172846 RepID=A0AAV4SQK0_CAEEX|nr:hypothetical protein CEXT_108401 [Caerostris extrusa]